ncbi:MAG TPA: asparagine synthase (glutamine-hydrolyzing), partial [Candidatus Acidoferrum sp.]|nr:asparagine synthase (glutamine-hydrolyzing) [Candidatus Acidoferrum sp.]
AERDRAHVMRMCDAIAHRGPDDAGLWQSDDGRVVLGHRRLAIVDLSPAGHQPMSNEDGSVWITFNGEIYNHAELRQTLRLDDRHQFRSRSDTEVIIHLYEERQLGVVEAIDGMFAFGLWDGPRRRLVLARDRMGKKPIYYAVVAGRLLFSSEIKALLGHPDVARRLDMVALNQYLTFSNVPEPRTMFEGIRKVPAGHHLVCDQHGSLTVERYWSPLDGPDWKPPSDRREAVEHVRDLVKEAVRKRLMADVPVGAFLSGGVDSSTSVALMSRLVSTPLQTFTIDFTGFGPTENFHDVPYARQVASMFGCRHTEVQVTAGEALDYLPWMVQHQDEPLGDPACLPMHFVSRAAHQAGLKVVLVGEGSDEVFCGYPDFATLLKTFNTRWSLLKRMPRMVRRAVKIGAELTGQPGGRVDVLRRAAEDEPLYMGLDVVFFDWEKAQLYTEAGRRAMPLRAADTVTGYYREILDRRPDADFSQQMSYIELRNRLPELLLMRVDKYSMAHSLEARAPFLDHALATYALSLPAAMKMNGTRTKTVLKDAAHEWLPVEVVERRKQGFRVPLPAWLRGELAPWVDDLLLRSPLRQLGMFDFDYILDLWRRHREGQADHSFDIWCLINLSGWYERWFAA